MLRAVMKKYGQFYLTQNYICFESTVFGMSNKEAIALNKVRHWRRFLFFLVLKLYWGGFFLKGAKG